MLARPVIRRVRSFICIIENIAFRYERGDNAGSRPSITMTRASADHKSDHIKILTPKNNRVTSLRYPVVIRFVTCYARQHP